MPRKTEPPVCSICRDRLDEIHVPRIIVWQESWTFPKQYPLRAAARLCFACRLRHGVPDKGLLVPLDDDEDYEVALERKLAEVRRFKSRHGAEEVA